MPPFLPPHVFRHVAQLLHAHGPQVVSRRPPQRVVARETIPVRKSRTGALKSLNQPGYVEGGWQLEQHVHMIAHDANLNCSGTVPPRLLQQEARKELGYPFVDQWQPRERGPGEVSVDAHRHDLRLQPGRLDAGTEKPRGTSFRTRVVAEPALQRTDSRPKSRHAPFIRVLKDRLGHYTRPRRTDL